MLVVDQDPFDIEADKLRDIQVEKTIVGGRLRFQL